MIICTNTGCIAVNENAKVCVNNVYHVGVLLSLTVNMLNCFKYHKRYTCIQVLNRSLDLASPKWIKLTLEQQYMLCVLHRQYHAYWCSGDFKSQGISRNGIDPWSRNILSPASELTLPNFLDRLNFGRKMHSESGAMVTVGTAMT